jgi:hypothetical protein
MANKTEFLNFNKKNFIKYTSKLQKLFFINYPYNVKDVSAFHLNMMTTEIGVNLYYAIYHSVRRVANSSSNVVRSQTVDAHIDINPLVSNWVESSFETVVGNTSEPNNYVSLVNSIIYSFTYLNPESTVVYGTFAYHLDNLAIPYNDIDISTTDDFDLLMIILYGFHMFVKLEVDVLSIPYIVNHRCIKIISNGTKLADIHHIDQDVLEFIPRRHISNLYVLDDIFAFFNTFRSLSVEERRKSISSDKQKFINILSLLTMKCETYYKSNPDQLDLTIINSNLMCLKTNSGHTFYFVNGVLDKDYVTYVKALNEAIYKTPYKLTVYKRLSNLFSDRLIESKLTSETIGKTKMYRSEYWINTSRNNLYSVKPTELKTPVISDLTKLYLYGSAGIVGIYLKKMEIVSLFYSIIIDSLRNKLNLNNLDLYSNRVKNNLFHNHISINPLSFFPLFPEDRFDKLQWKLR